jgi:hypothetical protein
MPMTCVRMSSSPSVAMRAETARISAQRLPPTSACSTPGTSHSWTNHIPCRVPSAHEGTVTVDGNVNRGANRRSVSAIGSQQDRMLADERLEGRCRIVRFRRDAVASGNSFSLTLQLGGPGWIGPQVTLSRQTARHTDRALPQRPCAFPDIRCASWRVLQGGRGRLRMRDIVDGAFQQPRDRSPRHGGSQARTCTTSAFRCAGSGWIMYGRHARWDRSSAPACWADKATVLFVTAGSWPGRMRGTDQGRASGQHDR